MQAISDSRQWQQGGEYFGFGAQRIFPRSAGAGEALLLVHGFPTSSYNWANLWPTLASRYRS